MAEFRNNKRSSDSKRLNRKRKGKRDARSARFDKADERDRRFSGKRDNSATCDRTDNRDERMSGLNDFSWYNQYPSLLTTAASVPYPYRPGMVIPMADATIATSSSATQTYTDAGLTVPGVCRLGWLPSVGQSSSPTDPASIVGKEVYAAVRKVYSGSIDADAPDFVMYLLALDSIFSYIGALKRIYRVINAYSPDNFVTPDVLLSSLCSSSALVANIRQNPMDFARCINELALQSQKFRCPAILDVFNRHYWLNDNVYTDAATINSQFYVFKQEGFFKIDPNAAIPNDSTNTAAGLTMVSGPLSDSTVTSYTQLYEFGLGLIAALDAWDDSYMISGYLMRAFEGTPSFAVDLLQLDERFVPLYVEEVLSQIENARTAFVSPNLADCRVYQNPLTNAVIHQPIVSAPSARSNGGLAYLPPVLSIRNDVPTVEETVIASRLQTVTAEGVMTPIIKGNLESGHALICGTEILTNIQLFGVGSQGTSASTVGTGISSVVCLSSTYVDNWERMQLPNLFFMSAFDWHPITFIGWLRGGR